MVLTTFPPYYNPSYTPQLRTYLPSPPFHTSFYIPRDCRLSLLITTSVFFLLAVHYHHITYITFTFFFHDFVPSTSILSSHEPLPLLITIHYPYHSSPLPAVPSLLQFPTTASTFSYPSFVGTLLFSYATPTLTTTSFDCPASLHSTLTQFRPRLALLQSNNPISSRHIFPWISLHSHLCRQTPFFLLPTLLPPSNHYYRCTLHIVVFRYPTFPSDHTRQT